MVEHKPDDFLIRKDGKTAQQIRDELRALIDPDSDDPLAQIQGIGSEWLIHFTVARPRPKFVVIERATVGFFRGADPITDPVAGYKVYETFPAALGAIAEELAQMEEFK